MCSFNKSPDCLTARIAQRHATRAETCTTQTADYDMGHFLCTLHMQELRVKGSYLHHKEITAAQGVKIAAPGLENAVAGTQLLVVGKDDDVSLLKEEVMQDMESIFDSVDRSGRLG